MNRLFCLLFSIAPLFATGCAQLTVHTNTYLGERPFPQPGPALRIAVEAEAQAEPLLLEQEVARLIRDELSRLGYRVVDSPQQADYVVTCEFGTTQMRQVVQSVPRSDPVYSSSRLYDRHGHYAGRIRRYGYRRYYDLESYREFDRYLLLSVIDRPMFDQAADADKGDALVWQASSACSTTEPDLRRVVRYLVAAAFEDFGGQSNRAVTRTYRIGDDDYRRFDPDA